MNICMHCSGCNQALTQENEMLALLASKHPEPDAALLASCRAGLEDVLDQQEEKGWLRRTVGALLPSSWISPQPAWSAALLVLIGFSVGMLGPRLLRDSAGKTGTNSSALPITPRWVPPESRPRTRLPQVLPPLDSAHWICTLRGRRHQRISHSGQPASEVQLQLKARQPFTVRGTVNDDDVKFVLMYILRNSQRFDRRCAAGCGGFAAYAE